MEKQRGHLNKVIHTQSLATTRDFLYNRYTLWTQNLEMTVKICYNY